MLLQYSLSFSRSRAFNVVVVSQQFKGSLEFEFLGSKLLFKGGRYLKNFPPHEEVAKTLLPILENLKLSEFFSTLWGEFTL
jgi:hypothetical protein